MLLFAVFMAAVRYSFGLAGEKIDLSKFMCWCSGITVILYIIAALSPIPIISLIACALTGITVAMLWPGALSLAAARFPNVGATLFAMLACCGDTGGATFPWLMGLVSDNSGFIHKIFSYIPSITNDALCLRSGLLIASIVPLLLFAVHISMRLLPPEKDE
ncbi:MAG: hypothetical protein Q4E99_04110 [Bacillota bacterium]|nr:hypothetical protein [Bacillota bacterium]